MADIAPELYDEIKRIFDEKFAQAQLLGNSLGDVMARINSGAASFQDADLFAVEVGSMMADAMKEVLILEDLPGGKLYRNIAQRTIGEGLKDTYGIVSNAAATIQEEINGRNNIGLKAVKPKLETDRVDKIVNRASNAKTQTALENNLTDAVPTFARQVVDDTQKANARLHDKAGLEVTVVREYDGVGLHDGTDACEWCLSRADTWTYDKALSAGVFERHEGCGCIIEYTSKKGEKTISTSKYSGWKGREHFIAKEQEVLDRQSLFNEVDKMATSNELSQWEKTIARNISKEEKSRLIEYAESKGVYAVDLSRFDGDPELFKACIDALADINKQLPTRKKVFLTVQELQDDDFGKLNNHTIVLNRNVLRNREITEKNILDAEIFASTNVEDIVRHEYGHFYVKVNGINQVEIVNRAYYNTYGQSNEDVNTFLSTNISKYSSMKKGEKIPEILASIGNKSSEFTNEVMRLLKEYGK